MNLGPLGWLGKYRLDQCVEGEPGEAGSTVQVERLRTGDQQEARDSLGTSRVRWAEG
jgi:hypothetical protein